MAIKERYWNFLVKLKVEIKYFSRYAAHCEKWDNRINWFVAIVSSGSVSIWAIWQDMDVLWAILVGASQVLNLSKQYLPYHVNGAKLKKVSHEFEAIYLKAERDWFNVSTGRLTDTEINELLFDYQEQQLNFWKQQGINAKDILQKGLYFEATRDAGTYFEKNFRTEIELGEKDDIK